MTLRELFVEAMSMDGCSSEKITKIFDQVTADGFDPAALDRELPPVSKRARVALVRGLIIVKNTPGLPAAMAAELGCRRAQGRN
jgi:hypothetical protein